MQIVLEGPDNAGKSTLADYLAKKLGIPIQHSGGPSKFPGEVNSRTFEFNMRRGTYLYDRYPAISQNIYAAAFADGRELVTEERVDEFYRAKPLIIYCKNIGGKVEDGGHIASEHSTQAHADLVTRHFEVICDLYDAWAVERANIVYRIGDDMDRIASLVHSQTSSAVEMPREFNVGNLLFDPLGDIEAFHSKFDLTYTGKPRVMPEELTEFRFNFLQEEKDEWETADYDAKQALAIPHDEAEFVHQLELQLDASVDLAYVLFGNVYLQGMLPAFAEAWRRVHAANMNKVRAEKAGDSARGSVYDVVKPAGWEPPKHTDLIEDHAHRDLFRTRVSSDA